MNIKSRFTQMLFDGEWDSQEYCDFSSTAASTIAGKDVLLSVWNETGTQILAVAGQQDLSLSREAATSEITMKDSENDWSSATAGTRSWSVDCSGVYVTDDDSQQILSKAFEDGDSICIKIYNKKTKKGMFGGIGIITSFSVEAPTEDAVTYSMTIQGQGKLTDFSIGNITHDTIPGKAANS